MPLPTPAQRRKPRPRRGCNDECLRRVAYRLCRLANEDQDACGGKARGDATRNEVDCCRVNQMDACCTTSGDSGKHKAGNKSSANEVNDGCAPAGEKSGCLEQCCSTEPAQNVTTKGGCSPSNDTCCGADEDEADGCSRGRDACCASQAEDSSADSGCQEGAGCCGPAVRPDIADTGPQQYDACCSTLTQTCDKTIKEPPGCSDASQSQDCDSLTNPQTSCCSDNVCTATNTPTKTNSNVCCSGREGNMLPAVDESATGDKCSCCPAPGGNDYAEPDNCCEPTQTVQQKGPITSDACMDNCCKPSQAAQQKESIEPDGCADGCCKPPQAAKPRDLIESEGCADGCCKPAQASQQKALVKTDVCEDGCCSPSGGAKQKDSMESGGCADDCCNPSKVVKEKSDDCVDDCCSLLSETTTTASLDACSEHLKTVFERYQSMLVQGLCLCRRIRDQLGFCCCCLASDGSTKTSRGCKTRTRTPRKSMSIEKVRNDGLRHRSGLPLSKISKGIDPGTIDAVRHGGGLEKGAAREHVVLSVSGMTCTGCSTKMMNVLGRIEGLSGGKVAFVSGIAEFDLDGTMPLDETLARIEKETGFKLTHIVTGHQHLDVCLTPDAFQQMANDPPGGVVSVMKLSKYNHRVTYDPRIVGARDLLIDGVELAPPTVDANVAQDRRHLRNMAVSFTASTIFTIPVLVLTWGNTSVSHFDRSVVSLVLGTLVQAIAVPEFYFRAFKSLIYSHVLEMDMLVVISITAAYIYSVVAFGLAQAGIKLQQEAFFEASTLLITLVLLGRLLSALARVRAVAAVSVRSLQSDTALLVQPGGEVATLDARLLHFGDTIRIPAHTQVVSDGNIISGESAVDESMVTGESLPVSKKTGSQVIAGTMNGAGSLDVILTRLPGENSITDIADLVENAMGEKPRVQNLADTLASYFVPVVIGIALLVFLIWVAIGIAVRHDSGSGAVGTAITYGITVLVISCPCALGLAVPMVLVIAAGVSAKAGVVIRSADIIEDAYKTTDVIFDKTGTLTKGDLEVVHQETLPSSITDDTIISITKALVEGNTHLVSAGISSCLATRPIPACKLLELTSVPGSGIQATWQGSSIKAGSPYWLGVDKHPRIIELLNKGVTLFCETLNDELIAIFGLKGTLRDEAPTVITELHRRKITCHIVSGDSPSAVADAAQALGIPSTYTAALHKPSDKETYVATLQARGRRVLFCGDGINDAAAVARAHVGVQMGSASDITGAAADVVLLGGLEGVVATLDLSRKAARRVYFNFAWAGVYNLFAMLLAAGAFVDFRIPPAYAGLGEIVSVAPVIVVAVSLMFV